MKVEGNNEILLKTLKSLQKHYIRIEIDWCPRKQKYLALNYTLLFRKFIIKVAEKMKLYGLPYMHSLSFHNETFTVKIKKK